MPEAISTAVLSLVEACIACVYLDYLFERKRKLWLYIISFALGYGILFGLSWLDRIVPDAIGFTLINFLLIIFNYRCGIKTALIHSAFLCFLMMTAEILISLVITLFGYSYSECTRDFTMLLTLMVWSKMLYMVFATIGALVFSPHKQENTEPGAMLLFCVLPISSVAATAAITYIGMSAGVNRMTTVVITIAVIVLLLMNLLFLGIYNHIQRINREHLALQLALQRDQADAAHYQALQAQYENQRILVHDIKNHLSVIDAMALQGNTEEISTYIHKLDASLKAVPQARMCSEPILNMLLLRFHEECRKKKISLQCDIRDHCLHFLDTADITTLFGNLLTNAVEATAACEEADRRISLSVRRNIAQASVVISLENPCDQPPDTDAEGNFITRKKDRIRHGVGLKSIRRVVKKYHGMETLRYDADSRRFCHIIHFPDLQ